MLLFRTITQWFMYLSYYYSMNGNPFGEFGLANASLSATTIDSTTTRSLSYTIVRTDGENIGSNIIIQHSYNQVYPSLHDGCHITSE